MIPISVVMSVYNTPPKYLEESIHSILSQTFTDFEFLIIDDGSSHKDTLAILAEVKDNRTKIITNAKNIGLTKSLNIGLDHARGKLIARQDSDDVSLPHRFAAQIEHFQPNIGMVGCWAQLISETGNPIRDYWCDHIVRSTKSEIRQLLKQKTNPFVATGAIFSQKAMKSVGYFDPVVTYAQDYNYWLRIIDKFDFQVVPEVLVYKRRHRNCIWEKLRPMEFIEIAYERARQKPHIPPITM